MRYEYVGGTSRKFWKVYPVDQSNGDFVVRVCYGRIGTSGQENIKVFTYESAAIRYRQGKIDEKLRKGYKAVSAPPQPKAPTIVAPKPKPVCQHITLVRRNNVYECGACKNTVEFDKTPVNVETPEFEQRVRRFFARPS